MKEPVTEPDGGGVVNQLLGGVAGNLGEMPNLR